jgi:hypothetical protein
MATVDWIIPITYKIDSNFSWIFDEIVNCQVKWRKSEQWFVDKNKLSLVMRPWITKVWSNTLTWWVWTSKLFFHTTFTWDRFWMRWYWNRVYWNKTWVRTDIWVDFWWNDFNYNIIRLPIMYPVAWVITLPTEYTMPSDATGSEKVKKSASDTWWVANIWKYIFITDNSWDWQLYRWCFWIISWYNSTTSEYLIGWSWILWSLNWTIPVWIKSWSKYQVYDTIWEHLQVINWLSYDRYFYYNSTSQTFIENTKYQWLATLSMRAFWWITWTQFTNRQVFFNNTLFTFVKWRIYQTKWNIMEPNPFFFTVFSWETISMSWNIQNIYEFKDRLIINWSNFAKLYTKDWKIETISTSWGIVKEWFNDLNNDAYVFTSDKQLQSLVENIKWSIVPQNIWEEMQNYMDDFNTWVCTWFDWKRFYLYWKKDANTDWKLLVLDVRYKFWSVWTWINPSSIVSEQWVLYFTDLKSELVTYLNDSVQTDNLVAINQYITTREIDLEDAFVYKFFKDAYFWFDNYDQNIKVTLFWAMNRIWATLKDWFINITEKIPLIWNWTLGEWQVWWVLLWWDPFITDISYPFFEKVTIWTDKANIFKMKIEWVNWSAFYLNQFDVSVWFYWDKKSYFSPANTH